MRRSTPAGRCFFTAGVALLFCIAAMAARAQAPAAGSLQGTVTDPTGAVMPGVEVEIQNEGTGAVRRVRTDSIGYYIAPALTPGHYRVTFTAPGFAPNVFEGVVVSIGHSASLDVKMDIQPGDIFEIVPGWVSPLEPERTEVSSTMRETALRNLPLNGRRWEDLVLLTPAVTEDGGNGLISYRGLSGLYNSNLVDGVDNNQAFFSETRGRSRLPYVYSLSTVQEFQVITQNYSPESGRAAGGIVNAVTRSGSNQLHGELFYFFRDDALLARDPLAKALDQPKPKERLQQFGAALGGPLLRNRLFWFGAYDQQLRDFPFTVVPQDPNFADACTIPQCPPAMDFIRSLLGARPRQGDQNLFLVKLDWFTHGTHSFSGVVNYVNWRSLNGILRDPVVNDAAEALGNDDVRAEFLIFTWQAVPTRKVFNEFRFHFGRDFEFQQQNTSGPLIDLTGFRAIRLGMREFLPRVAFPNEKRFQWTDSTSVATGRHLLKFGVDINHTRDRIVQVFRGGGIYRWRTANDFARDFVGACPTNGGRCYRDFFQTIDPFGGDGRASFSTTDWGFYVQDSLRLGRDFLLNVGLRYELQQMPDPQRPNPAVPMTAVLNTDSNNLAPRVALAWQPAERLVVRAGYGLYYGRTPNSTLFSHLFQNGVSQQAFRFLPSDCAAPLFPNVVFSPPPGAPLGPPAAGLPAPVVQPPPPGCTINPSASVVTTLARDFVNPLVHQAEFNAEVQPAQDWVVSATYLMSRTNRLPIFLDSNVAPATGTAT
ncbi:MAG: TonB-dependent receptor, partial [Acidobacteria bacterium]|nr:TonB-dependent receptor [Acidobacteriota bacterium]